MSPATDTVPVNRDRHATSRGPVLALDLGASRIRAAVVAQDARLLARGERRTPGADGPAAVVEACIAQLRQVLASVDDATRRGIVGVGISAIGPVDAASGTIIDPPNVGPGFVNVAIGPSVADALALPVVVERDTNVAALGEQSFGAARGARDFLYITVSTGLGGAIVAGGELYGGADGGAGEMGHVPVQLDEPPCGCGGAGHLEALSSGSGIARQARIAVEAGRAPGLAAVADRVAPEPLEARHVAEAADAGDADAAAIMELARRSFAAAIVGFVNVFNPELIVVGGSLARAQGDRWLDPARREVERIAFTIPRRRVRIVAAALGDDVGLVGAQPLIALRGG
ncbi:MAG TPA: ROK family protein [Candidatus Limnocylindrales bacterium]